MLNTRNPAVLATLALLWAMPTIAQTAPIHERDSRGSVGWPESREDNHEI